MILGKFIDYQAKNSRNRPQNIVGKCWKSGFPDTKQLRLFISYIQKKL